MLNESSEFISFNYDVISGTEFDSLRSAKSTIVYEVIRLMNGVPMFWEAHFRRLKKSLRAVNSKAKVDKIRIEQNLSNLISANQFQNTNIRIDVFDENILIFGIQAHYPMDSAFKLGVKVGLTKSERQNPNEKIFRKQWKKDIEQKISDAGVFELLLVNKQELITEGSRSNVFFIRGNSLFSAEDSLILPGVTRSEILKIAIRKKIEIKYVSLDSASLPTFEAALLCATSIQILPIAELNDLRFNVDNACLRIIQKAFEKHSKLEYYRASRKWKK